MSISMFPKTIALDVSYWTYPTPPNGHYQICINMKEVLATCKFKVKY